MTEPYKMPPVDAGSPVLFYPGANRALKPMVGFVSVANPQNLCIHVLTQESYNFLIRDGVRHVSDPALTSNPHTREDGAWDYHPLSRAVMCLQEEVGKLRGKVADLCLSLGEPTKVG